MFLWTNGDWRLVENSNVSLVICENVVVKALSRSIELNEQAVGLMRGRGPAAGDWLLLESSQARASRPG